jgi:DnaK suppressor protein
MGIKKVISKVVKSAQKSALKSAPTKKTESKKVNSLNPTQSTQAKIAMTKKSAPKKPEVKVPLKKAALKKTAVKKVVPAKAEVKATSTKKSPTPKQSVVKPVADKVFEKKSTVAKSPNIVKPSLAKPPAAKIAKKAPAKQFPAKLQSTTTGDSTTITVTPHEANVGPEPVIEERRLVMPPPPRPAKSTKKSVLKPIKLAPAPLIANVSEDPWSTAELKAIRIELAKELLRLAAELAEAESEMDDLISSAGTGAGDDQADAGAKTFEREHEMSLVYNARDMVLQTERALERIDNRTYGRCEECGNSVGKERLKVFPRATLCMSCKQKEERR